MSKITLHTSLIELPQNKKRDCNLAVPLVEALVLPFVPNNNTVAHAVCTCTYIYVPINTYHEHLVLQCFGTYEFTRFLLAKTKR